MIIRQIWKHFRYSYLLHIKINVKISITILTIYNIYIKQKEIKIKKIMIFMF